MPSAWRSWSSCLIVPTLHGRSRALSLLYIYIYLFCSHPDAHNCALLLPIHISSGCALISFCCSTDPNRLTPKSFSIQLTVDLVHQSYSEIQILDHESGLFGVSSECLCDLNWEATLFSKIPLIVFGCFTRASSSSTDQSVLQSDCSIRSKRRRLPPTRLWLLGSASPATLGRGHLKTNSIS